MTYVILYSTAPKDNPTGRTIAKEEPGHNPGSEAPRKNKLSESFELKLPETLQIPEGYEIIKVIAKTPAPTIHPEDPEHKIRIFDTENEAGIPEIVMASRSLALRPIGINHEKIIPEAIVANSDWNFKDKVLEALLMVPHKIAEMIKKKEMKKVSVDFIWDSVIKAEGKSFFKGLKFTALHLLDGRNPGDPGANILLESKTGRETLELELFQEKVVQRNGKWCVIHCHGPDAGKAIKCFDNKDDADAMHRAIQASKAQHGEATEDDRPPEPWFSDCVNSVSDKADDPEALCNWIWHNMESETAVVPEDFVNLIEQMRVSKELAPLKEAIKRLEECLPK